jgi:hypothetical protein
MLTNRVLGEGLARPGRCDEGRRMRKILLALSTAVLLAVPATTQAAVGEVSSHGDGPETRWASPSSGDKVSGVLSATATGAQACVATVGGVVGATQAFVDGVPVGDPKVEAPYGCEWDTTTVPNGPHTLELVVSRFGEINRASVDVIVDNPPAGPPPADPPPVVTPPADPPPVVTPPADPPPVVTPPADPPPVDVPPADPVLIELTNPSAGQHVAGTLTPTGTGGQGCSATVSGSFDRTQAFVDGVAIGEPRTSAPYGCEWDTTTAANGAHRLEIVAYLAGVEVKRAGVEVLVDNTRPVGAPPAGDATPGPVAVHASTTSPAAAASAKPALAVSAARTHLDKVLASLFKKEFRRSTLKASARRSSGTAVVFRVSWRTKRYTYRGTVRVFLTDALHYRSHIERRTR